MTSAIIDTSSGTGGQLITLVSSGTGQYVYATGYADRFRSQDYGATFSSITSSNICTSCGYISGAQVSYTGQYVVLYQGNNAPYVTYISNDFGVTYTTIGAISPDGITNYICISSRDQNLILATAKNSLYYPNTIILSTDHGQTFQDVGPALTSSIITFVQLSTTGTVIQALRCNYNDDPRLCTLCTSHDTGVTYTLTALPYFMTQAFGADSTGQFLMGVSYSDGLTAYSNDWGVTWAPVDNILQGIYGYNLFSFDSTGTGALDIADTVKQTHTFGPQCCAINHANSHTKHSSNVNIIGTSYKLSFARAKSCSKFYTVNNCTTIHVNSDSHTKQHSSEYSAHSITQGDAQSETFQAALNSALVIPSER
eukprot:gene30417-37629_t